MADAFQEAQVVRYPGKCGCRLGTKDFPSRGVVHEELKISAACQNTKDGTPVTVIRIFEFLAIAFCDHLRGSLGTMIVGKFEFLFHKDDYGIGKCVKYMLDFTVSG